MQTVVMTSEERAVLLAIRTMRRNYISHILKRNKEIRIKENNKILLRAKISKFWGLGNFQVPAHPSDKGRS